MDAPDRTWNEPPGMGSIPMITRSLSLAFTGAGQPLGQQPSLVRIESRALTETLVELATAVTTGELLSSGFLVCLS